MERTPVKIESYSLESENSYMAKRASICVTSGNGLYPLVYLSRPKWIKDDTVWEQVVKSIRLELPTGFELK